MATQKRGWRVRENWRRRPIEPIIGTVLLLLLVVTALAILWMRDLFAVIILSGIYSLLMAGSFTVLDAVDVAFTEAAVGAGVSTVLLLATLALQDMKTMDHDVRP